MKTGKQLVALTSGVIRRAATRPLSTFGGPSAWADDDALEAELTKIQADKQATSD